MHELRVIPRPDRATPGQVRLVQVAVAVWTLAWVGAAIWIAVDIDHLDRWASVMSVSAHALRNTASGLGAVSRLRSLPAATAAATELRGLAAQVAASATQTRSGIDQLSVTIGVAVAGVPTLPALYALARFQLERRRERRALAAALADDGLRPVAVRYLAEAAQSALTLGELADLHLLAPAGGRPARPDPDTETRLARAELRRLGLAAWPEPATADVR